MPLLKPEVQKILRAAGLDKSPEPSKDLFVHQHLDNTGLSNERIAEELTSIAINSGSDHLRLRALETALRVKGALKDTVQAPPNFTIVIQNSAQDFARTQGINPIVFPRQSLAAPIKQEVLVDVESEPSDDSEDLDVEVELEEDDDDELIELEGDEDDANDPTKDPEGW